MMTLTCYLIYLLLPDLPILYQPQRIMIYEFVRSPGRGVMILICSVPATSPFVALFCNRTTRLLHQPSLPAFHHRTHTPYSQTWIRSRDTRRMRDKYKLFLTIWIHTSNPSPLHPRDTRWSIVDPHVCFPHIISSS